MAGKRELGERIKRLRLDRNLTLKQVELRANVSATHVSEIERGMTSPTVGALSKIARAMGTEPAYFLQGDANPRVSVVRRSERRALTYDNWRARIHCLTDGQGATQMSFLEAEIDPGSPSETLEPMTRYGEELIHVRKGVIEVRIGEATHLLKEGDSIHFRADAPHTIRNIGDAHARIVWVATPPFYL